MIDSHCHLADKQFATDVEAVIARAGEKGVERMITISDSIPESKKCLEIAKKFDQVFCTVGVHPHCAKDWKDTDSETLRSFVVSSPKVRAIGEIGLDYHYDFSPHEIQQSVFRSQLVLAGELKLSAVVHCREAIADVRAALRGLDVRRVVLHCCTEKWEDVEELVGQGMRLSFTGIATYPHAENIRTAIKECPIGQMMVETDAPYLAPVPHRGKRNEPAFVAEVAKLVAKLKGLSIEEVDRITTENTVAFFGLPS
ncbi:MAG: TatD family hydrolase [Candidatus Peribacteraceae bacterium]|jgi:TatD DNase family protein|nr:TatD family hydrolase [Candidatus Peribacteraceae bacterium]MDD5075340.1 TatD family hydrolase [Candidatus Peribacteraceae bacterium]